MPIYLSGGAAKVLTQLRSRRNFHAASCIAVSGQTPGFARNAMLEVTPDILFYQHKETKVTGSK
jgi:hypothetical protein